MAVTITVTELLQALRLDATDTDEIADATRLLEYATEAVTRHVADCPDAVHNEAVRRLSGYLRDMPEAARGDAYSNALRNSGASRMLLPYRLHSGGLDGVAEAQAAVGSANNPVISVEISGSDLVVTFADGTTESTALPAGMGGAIGVDQAARNAAIDANKAAMDAQAAADAAQVDATANTTTQTTHAADPNAHHVPTAGGGVVSESLRLPVGTVAMRMGWAQTTTVAAAIFTRANNHPTDGAAVGTVSGLNPPVFPPALNTDTNLYLFIWIAAAKANIADIRLAGGTLQGSISTGTAYTLENVAGTVYVSNQRLTAGTSAYQVTAIVGGELIASQPWVNEQLAGVGGGAPVLIGTATVPVGQTPFTLRMPTAATTAFYAAYNASTYEGGYRVDFNWTAGTINHAFSAILGATVWDTLADNQSYQWHIDVGAALDGTSTRLINFNRIGGDYIEFQTLPSADDLEGGTVFKLWGLP